MRTTNISLKLAAGQTGNLQSFQNTKGFIVAAFVTVSKEDNLPNDTVFASLNDTSNKPIIKMPLEGWKRGSGEDFYKSLVPVSLSENNLQFEINTKTAPAEDLVFNICLVHENQGVCDVHR